MTNYGARHPIPELRPRPGWQARARCAGVELSEFYGHEDLIGKAAVHAGELVADVTDTWCRDCPVRRECLAEAIATDEQWGIWGGLDRAARNTIAERLRRRREAAA